MSSSTRPDPVPSLGELFKFILPYWTGGLAGIAYLFLATSASLVYPLIPKFAIDNMFTEGTHSSLTLLASAFLLLVVLQRLFTYLNEVSFYRFQKTAILRVQEELLGRLFRYPLEFFEKTHSGYLLGRIRGDVAGLSYLLSGALITGLIDALRVCVSIVILTALSPKLTVFAVAIIPGLAFTIARSSATMGPLNRRVLELSSVLEKELSDVFQGIEVLKCFSKEAEGEARARIALKSHQEAEIACEAASSKSSNMVELIVRLGDVLILYFGIREVIAGQLTLGSYVAFTGYVQILYSPMRSLSVLWFWMDYARKSYERIKELTSILPEETGQIDPGRIHSIELRDVAFSYPGHAPLLNGLSFRIERTDRVLIGGESGAGKSTVLKLLMGLYKPDSGTILYNGTDLSTVEKSTLRERVGYISQSVFLFTGTLRDNLLLGRRDVSDAGLMTILHECRLLGRGMWAEASGTRCILDHQVMEKGSNLSGGERQRLALARALVKDPDILILDEATSNLDAGIEAEVETTIMSKFADRIIIKVSHRRRDADGWRIIRLDARVEPDRSLRSTCSSAQW